MLTLHQLDSFLTAARSSGWTVSRRAEPRDMSAPILVGRFGRIPVDYAFFLSHVTECVNEGQNAWFLTEADYKAQDVPENTFRWNEWELISLEACDGDVDLAKRVTDFWNAHLPIMSSVFSDYAYIAIRLSDGVVVYGYAPDFEEPSVVCQSLAEFLVNLGDLLSGSQTADVLWYSADMGDARQYTDFT